MVRSLGATPLEIKESLSLFKHLPGRHDQARHGDRFGRVGKNPRALVHIGGGAPGRNVHAYDEDGNALELGPKPPTEEERRLAEKSPFEHGEDFPVDLFEKAQVEEFNTSFNPTYKLEVDGASYFAKEMEGDEWRTPEDLLHNELRGPLIGEALGLKEHFLPVQSLQKNGHSFMVMEWKEGASSLFSEEGEKVLAALPHGEATSLYFSEYLMGEYDRHPGNYMVHNGKLYEIDFGFVDDTIISFNKHSTLYQLKLQDTKVTTKDLDAVLQKKEAVLKATSRYPQHDDIIQKRFRKLEKLRAVVEERGGSLDWDEAASIRFDRRKG